MTDHKAADASDCGQSAAVEAAETTCGQSALAEPSAAAHTVAGTTTCGQAAADAAEPVQSETQCGQTAAASAAATTCGQAAADSGTQCGQSAGTSCGQPAGQSGTESGFRRMDDLEMDAWRAFLTASTAVTATLTRELEAGAGISMHEYEILVRLHEAPEHRLRMSVLADIVSHSRSRLTHTVGRLERSGYVERSNCSMDKRGVYCHLTPAGAEFLATAAPIHLAGVRSHVIDRFSREDLATLTQLLGALIDEPEA